MAHHRVGDSRFAIRDLRFAIHPSFLPPSMHLQHFNPLHLELHPSCTCSKLIPCTWSFTFHALVQIWHTIGLAIRDSRFAICNSRFAIRPSVLPPSIHLQHVNTLHLELHPPCTCSHFISCTLSFTFHALAQIWHTIGLAIRDSRFATRDSRFTLAFCPPPCTCNTLTSCTLSFTFHSLAAI